MIVKFILCFILLTIKATFVRAEDHPQQHHDQQHHHQKHHGQHHHANFKTELPSSTQATTQSILSKFIAQLVGYFDARVYWPKCASIIGYVYNVGNCSAGWAAATAGMLNDRICIESRNRVFVLLSVQDLVSCCKECFPSCIDGGTVNKAINYWIRQGIVSGGDENRKGCKPYENSTYLEGVAPKCKHLCSNKQYSKSYGGDKYYGRLKYKLPSQEERIKLEIMLHGPVVAEMELYENIYQYNSGVYYKYTRENSTGTHAVKIIGWGVEKRKKYWLAVNNWGKLFGMDGLLKIGRGRNYYQIESNVFAARSSYAVNRRQDTMNGAYLRCIPNWFSIFCIIFLWTGQVFIFI